MVSRTRPENGVARSEASKPPTAQPEKWLLAKQQLLDGDRPHENLEAAWREQAPGLMECVASDRAEWGKLALLLADRLRNRTRSRNVRRTARALYAVGHLRDAVLVLCNDWIVSGLDADLREALCAVYEHASNVDLEPTTNLGDAEEGLRAAAKVLGNAAPPKPQLDYADVLGSKRMIRQRRLAILRCLPQPAMTALVDAVCDKLELDATKVRTTISHDVRSMRADGVDAIHKSRLDTTGKGAAVKARHADVRL